MLFVEEAYPLTYEAKDGFEWQLDGDIEEARDGVNAAVLARQPLTKDYERQVKEITQRCEQSGLSRGEFELAYQ